jgi:hypothetical protein
LVGSQDHLSYALLNDLGGVVGFLEQGAGAAQEGAFPFEGAFRGKKKLLQRVARGIHRCPCAGDRRFKLSLY